MARSGGVLWSQAVTATWQKQRGSRLCPRHGSYLKTIIIVIAISITIMKIITMTNIIVITTMIVVICMALHGCAQMLRPVSLSLQ